VSRGAAPQQVRSERPTLLNVAAGDDHPRAEFGEGVRNLTAKQTRASDHERVAALQRHQL
jgi:hypothetical protein